MRTCDAGRGIRRYSRLHQSQPHRTLQIRRRINRRVKVPIRDLEHCELVMIARAAATRVMLKELLGVAALHERMVEVGIASRSNAQGVRDVGAADGADDEELVAADA